MCVLFASNNQFPSFILFTTIPINYPPSLRSQITNALITIPPPMFSLSSALLLRSDGVIRM